MRRRTSRKVSFNQKLIMDVGLAGLAVRIIPILLNKFVPLDPTLYTVAGAGGGYLTGVMLKKPDLANASIALGVVEFVAPMVENLVGGFSPERLPTLAPRPVPPGANTMPAAELADYLSLNDYIPDPSVRQSVYDYRSSY